MSKPWVVLSLAASLVLATGLWLLPAAWIPAPLAAVARDFGLASLVWAWLLGFAVARDRRTTRRLSRRPSWAWRRAPEALVAEWLARASAWLFTRRPGALRRRSLP